MGTRDEKIRREEDKKTSKASKQRPATGRPDVRQDTEQVISHNPLTGKPKTK